MSGTGRNSRGGAAARGLPSDAVLLVGAAAFEREWAFAGRLAFYPPEERYFAGT